MVQTRLACIAVIGTIRSIGGHTSQSEAADIPRRTMLRLTSWLLTVMLVAVGADDISQALEQETCQGEDCALNALQLRGTVDPEPNSTRAASGVNMSWAHFGCCSGCSTRYCSPNSGTCYSYKGKYYYLDCYISTEPTTTRTTLDAADPKKDPQVVKVEQALETLRKRLEEAEEANDEPRWRVLAQLLLTEEPKLQRLRERVSANPSG
eukprot:symbB.v1.2.030153.t2/scaffold3362.1/size63757/6